MKATLEEKLKGLKSISTTLLIGVIVLLVFLIMAYNERNVYVEKLNACNLEKAELSNFDNDEFEAKLGIIYTNCNSGFFTKKHSDPRFWLYTEVCGDDLCYYEYIPWRNCLD